MLRLALRALRVEFDGLGQLASAVQGPILVEAGTSEEGATCSTVVFLLDRLLLGFDTQRCHWAPTLGIDT